MWLRMYKNNKSKKDGLIFAFFCPANAEMTTTLFADICRLGIYSLHILLRRKLKLLTNQNHKCIYKTRQEW